MVVRTGVRRYGFDTICRIVGAAIPQIESKAIECL
jgi:hypothetical protein